MARIIWDTPRLPDVGGSYTSQQNGQVVFTYLNGAVETLRGDFTYSGGVLNGGFVNEVTVVHNGLTIVSITEAQMPALQYFTARQAGDNTTLANLLFIGSDQIFGALGADQLPGGPGNDSIIALDGNDTVGGGPGDDDVNGNVGNDLVVGDDGEDWVRGGKDNDTLYGGAGNDPHVNGNLGDDLVLGELGNDTVFGGQGNDTLSGGSGDDFLSGDLGSDLLYGNAGADIFSLRPGESANGVGDFNPTEGDRILISGGVTYRAYFNNGAVVIDIGNGDALVLLGMTDASLAASWIL